MDEPKAWGTTRFIILFVVVAVHLSLFALLLASRMRSIAAATAPPVELMFLPPTKAPRVRATNIHPERLSTDITSALAPPVLNSSLQSGPYSAPDGHGSAVNWTAEARRAVRAFEIRRDRPPNSALSVSPSWDDWWPGEHHAGDQLKTPSGDWIVWINASCYQVASWHSNALAIDASPAQAICRPAPRASSNGVTE